LQQLVGSALEPPLCHLPGLAAASASAADGSAQGWASTIFEYMFIDI
jgi:hypothetical protein